MSVRVRMRRIGKNPKKKPFFRIGVFDQHTGRDSRVIEEIGYYNPVKGTYSVKSDRLAYWVKNGAEVSATVKSLAKKVAKAA